MKGGPAAIAFVVLLVAIPHAAAHTESAFLTRIVGGETNSIFSASPETSVFLSDGPGGAATPTWNSADGRYSAEYKCPGRVSSGGAGSTPFESRVCPAFVLDSEDVLSQPVLVIDPRDPQKMAFHALHGGPGIQLPTSPPPPGPAAREDAVHQPHTVFQSTNGGVEWFDNPYYSPFYDEDAAPDASGNGPRTWGVDNALTGDPRGNLYVASLYVHKPKPADAPQYVVALWQSGDAAQPFSPAAKGVIKRVNTSSSADSLHLGFVPGTEEAFAYVLERPTAGSPALRLWHAATNENPLRWEEIPSPAAFAGCNVVSNPVAVGSAAFVACSPPPAKSKNEPIPKVRILKLDAEDGWNTTKVSDVPLDAGSNLVLAAAPKWGDGMMALASAGVNGGRPYLLYTYGILGEHWRPALNFGAQVTATAGNPTAQAGAFPMSARVTAMAYVEKSNAFHLIYAERWDVSNAQTNAREFTKTYAVIHGGGQFLGTADLGYGDPGTQAAAPAHVAGTDSAVWYDQKDSIAIFGSGAGERVFVIFGDHGFARFAEVTSVDAPPPAIPLAPPVQPVPLPLAGVNPALVGASAGALSLALLMRMIASKKKVTAEAPAL